MAYWTVGSACSGMPSRSRLRYTAAIRGRSSSTLASPSTRLAMMVAVSRSRPCAAATGAKAESQSARAAPAIVRTTTSGPTPSAKEIGLGLQETFERCGGHRELAEQRGVPRHPQEFVAGNAERGFRRRGNLLKREALRDREAGEQGVPAGEGLELSIIH